MISKLEVQARWGYSEIVDGVFCDDYSQVVGIQELRAKRRKKVPFAELSAEDWASLALGCYDVRPCLLQPYFQGIVDFELVSLNRLQLGSLLVPPNVWERKDGFYPFSYYIATQSSCSKDARSASRPIGGYREPAEPLTIGLHKGDPVLLDGYHRAALFWKYGPLEGTLQAYMPITNDFS